MSTATAFLERTDAEILKQIERANDFLGTIRGDLIEFLPFDVAMEKGFLKADTTIDQWTPAKRDRDSLIDTIKKYMPFAWEKANSCRGISAGRSIDHMKAWLWMLGESDVSQAIAGYSLYGKPQLRAICEHFGVDWRSLDDARWRNNEHDEFGDAPVGLLVLPWR